jgi:tryptophanyl-tRNA synthetase
LNLTDADQYILQGNYIEAMNVYRNLLSIEPENKHVLQRVEELKALLKLLGKDKEELITKLENLLEGIKRRRDEFFGSS